MLFLRSYRVIHLFTLHNPMYVPRFLSVVYPLHRSDLYMSWHFFRATWSCSCEKCRIRPWEYPYICYKTYLASLRYSTWSLVWSWISKWQCTWCLVDITSKVATLQSSTILYSTDSVVGCTIHPSDFQCSRIKNHKIIIYAMPAIQNVMELCILHCIVRLG